MPKLSIGIPVFNGEDFLPELLESLLAQTFTDFEILICDNASSDRTPQICCAYERRDSRVHYIRNKKNLGCIANHNRVFELSSAPLFKWAAHDDLYHELYLDTCVRLLEEHPDVILAHSGTAFIDEKSAVLPFDQKTGSFIDTLTGKRYWADVPSIGDTPVTVSRFWQVLTRARWGTHMYGIIRREFLQKTSLLPDFAGSDRAMLAELSLLGRFRCTDERLFLKRLHAKASSSLNYEELTSFLSNDDRRYSRRLRQIKAFFGAPMGKPVSIATKSVCFILAAAHSTKVGIQCVAQEDMRRTAYGYGWPGPPALGLRRRKPD